MSAIHSMEIERGEVTARGHAQLVEMGLRQAMTNQINVRLGNKFRKNAENSPGGEYGYNPTRKYMIEKLRKGFGDVPNVRTGRLQKRMRVLSLPTIRATQHRSTAFLRAGFSSKGKAKGARQGMRPQQRRWFTSFSRADVQAGRTVAVNVYQTNMTKPQFRLRRKRRT